MFSLKFDLLFPSFDAAKDAAKKLNALFKPQILSHDPREYKRMTDELKSARERVAAQTLGHRNLFL